MTAIKKAAVAGVFYPDDAVELKSALLRFLHEARTDAPAPKAIIAPHAGYIYSGPIAASAYARVAHAHDTITRVILLGPSHRVPFQGLAASSADAFATPLGNVPVDRAALAAISRLPQLQTLDMAHAREHSLEVHLPFLQMVLDDFTIVPLVVGDARDKEVSEVLNLLWGGDETLIVISSDLSHYLNYDAARKLDNLTSEAVVSMQPDMIAYEQACGRIPVGGLLTAAREHGLHASLIDLRNSGDTAGPRDQVVGYGAYVFE